MKKRILSLFLTLLIIVSSIPFSAFPVSAATNGSCGDNLTWTLDTSTGILTISGSGDMADFFLWGAPWYSSRSYIKCVVIEKGITSIGNCAFQYCSSLERITIPATVTSIGKYAFEDCSLLGDVTIPDVVTSIGEWAFSNCAFKNITIPEKIISIGSYAFYNCASLENITLPESLMSIGAGVFSRCIALTSIKLPDGLMYIGASAFENCSSLKSITIPEGVTYIGEQAFYGCIDLASEIVIPIGVTRIEYGTFFDCASLKNVSISEGVVSIGSCAFYDCSSLVKIIIPDSVKHIESSAFNGCSSLTSITIPDSVTSIGSSAFAGVAYCNNRDNWEDGAVYISNCLIDVDGSGLVDYTVREGTVCIAAGTFYNCSSLTSIIITDGVRRIGDKTFFDCSSLTSVNLPNSIESIGYKAFEGCSSLTNITIPDSVTNIDEDAFRDCITLSDVIIGNNVKSIGYGAFYGTSYYKNLDNWADGVLYISNCLIKADTSITGEYIIRENTICMSESAFRDCNLLTGIIIPESVAEIERSTFSGCSSLSNVSILCDIKSIGEYAFYGCSLLSNVIIPSNVTSIGEAAFSGCSSLITVTIGDSINSIGQYAFSNCKSLETVYYAGTQEEWESISIENYNDCLLSANIVFLKVSSDFDVKENEQGITIIGYLGVASEVIVLSKIDGKEVIGVSKNAFAGNETITSITIPESVIYIEENAFDGCTSLEEIIYEGEMLPCPVESDELSEKAGIGFSGNGRIEVGFEDSTDETVVVEFTAAKTGSHYMFTDGTSLDAVWVYGENGELLGYEDSLDGSGEAKLHIDCVKGQTYYVVLRCINPKTVGARSVSAPVKVPTQLVINYTSDVYGDASADGKIAIADVLKIRKYIAGLESEDGLSILAADANGDGSISIADVLLIRKYIAGLITEFPAGK